MAGPVTDPTTKEQQRAEGQRVPGDDPLQVRRGEVQLPLDGRQRDVDDAGVELHHELGSDHEPERQAQPENRRCAGASRRRRHGGARLAERCGSVDRHVRHAKLSRSVWLPLYCQSMSRISQGRRCHSRTCPAERRWSATSTLVTS